MPRYTADRFDASSNYDQLHSQDRIVSYGNKEVRNTDHDFDRSIPTSPPVRGGPTASMHNVSSEKVWPEEYLRDKSIAAIKEFYRYQCDSNLDFCLRLQPDIFVSYSLENTSPAQEMRMKLLCASRIWIPPASIPMISLWLIDSFERKDMERDLLTMLLINLIKPKDGMISQDQVLKGFESALTVLEDAVNDAPRAAEFLGRIFAKLILANIVSFSEIGQLIYEGGEEEGRLVEIGLAAEVMGSMLDMIKSEKGDSMLNEIRSGSNLRLEKFKPPGSNKSWRIDKFI
ncbi:UNVERIFIED_CONTAM: Eukaryotic translation initiation factor 4G [Sesamum radiatum]|uniref:Eukaryotic translation initiation factor 4G n=1 Tax=Sesamum radiatum TaxID=300843 RepID=A0AAW2KP71_SESRA